VCLCVCVFKQCFGAHPAFVQTRCITEWLACTSQELGLGLPGGSVSSWGGEALYRQETHTCAHYIGKRHIPAHTSPPDSVTKTCPLSQSAYASTNRLGGGARRQGEDRLVGSEWDQLRMSACECGGRVVTG